MNPDFALHMGLYVCLALLGLYGLLMTHRLSDAKARTDRMYQDNVELAGENMTLAANLREARSRLLAQTMRADKLSKATAHAVGRHAELHAELERTRATLGDRPADTGQRRRVSDDEAALQQTMADALVHGTGMTRQQFDRDLGVTTTHVPFREHGGNLPSSQAGEQRFNSDGLAVDRLGRCVEPYSEPVGAAACDSSSTSDCSASCDAACAATCD